MTGGGEDDIDGERQEGFGPVDPTALRTIRDLCLEHEPLVDSARLEDPLNPQKLVVELADGVGTATAARFDVRWSLAGNYSFHYTDEAGRDFRFDCHPKPGAPSRHFHPPPDAPSTPVEPSCISVATVSLVTRAVLAQWRVAYDRAEFDCLNDAENPP